jgi:hypothetical protein
MGAHLIRCILALLCGVFWTLDASAQDLEPRAFSSAPIGLQFVALAYGHSSGDLVFDPTLPVEDAEAKVDALAIGYVRTLSLFGRTGKVSVVLPWVDGRATGLVSGEPAERRVTGFADARVGMSLLFYGAPASSAADFMKAKRSPTVAGISFVLGVPIGEVEEERVINIGTNRWSLKTEVGITHRIRKWSLEASAAAALFQDNDKWLVTSTRAQDPIYSVQAHIVRDFKPRLWVAFDATHYWGGQSTVDGEISGVELGNSRLGVTLSLPVAKSQSLKLTATSGVSTRTGTDFDTLAVAWQWAIPPRL